MSTERLKIKRSLTVLWLALAAALLLATRLTPSLSAPLTGADIAGPAGSSSAAYAASGSAHPPADDSR